MRHRGVLCTRKQDVLSETVVLPPTVRLAASALLTDEDIALVGQALRAAVAAARVPAAPAPSAGSANATTAGAAAASSSTAAALPNGVHTKKGKSNGAAAADAVPAEIAIEDKTPRRTTRQRGGK